MKKLSLLAAVAFFFAACANQSEESPLQESSVAHEEMHDMAAQDGSGALAEGPIDPVCNMVKSDDWTEFSVVDGDTTWFCAPRCKKAFDEDPSKYLQH